MTAATTARDLRAALQLAHAGQLAPARELLARVLASNPRLPEAHWVLAGLHYQAGDLAQAERTLATLLELDPAAAAGHALLGEVLSRTNRPQAAEQAFRRALALQPDHLPAAGNLAHLLLLRGEAGEAVALTAACIRRGHATPDLLMLHGRALLATGKASDAVDTFRRVLQLAPHHGEGQAALAAALTESGQHAQAEKLLRSAIARGRVIPEMHFVLARALIAQNRFDEAAPELRLAVQARPDYTVAQLNLCELLWMQTGDAQAAGTELDAALTRNPGLQPLRVVKAKLLEAAGDLRGAMAVLEAGISRAGADAELSLAIAQIAIKCDPARALQHAGNVYHALPGDRQARETWCSALLAAGRAVDASAIADQLHREQPDNSHYLALQALAWRLLDDPRYRALYDYDFVLPQRIDTPSGWTSLAAYLADLAAALRGLHGHRTHPIGQSLRRGTQVDLDLAQARDPAIRAFPQAIDGPIRRYMETIGRGDDALRRRNTGRHRLNGAWSVRLRPHGHHVNHIHPDGWLSSACYIELPPLADDGEHAAWIQFGQPGFMTTPPLPAEHFVQPEPGLLALFPSYMWHGTVPFDGGPETSRLTIAFDVVPD